MTISFYQARVEGGQVLEHWVHVRLRSPIVGDLKLARRGDCGPVKGLARRSDAWRYSDEIWLTRETAMSVLQQP